ncbi:MAG: endolytic transglycosylase MltG [Spirochaetes bacterium]|nr:endolytic transglycosylase MltG [Spirochaetota bacterium]
MKKTALAVALTAAAFLGLIAWLNAPPAGMMDTVFTVTRGETIRVIARNLEKRGLIKSRSFFLIASRPLWSRYVRAGRYRITERMTTLGIMLRLFRGEIVTRRITIPEGFNLYQIRDRLEANGITPQGSFMRDAEDPAFLRRLGISSQSAEGYLFPDTYRFPEDSDARDVIRTMHRRLKQVIEETFPAGHGSDLHRVLTMASLIEKEARIPSERGIISSVFHNRLKRGMKLDCDPTVRYAVKRFTGPIRLSDLRSDSPYNTYRRGGLPPTPICSPGRESIVAALRPDASDYLFFVARNDGSHHFSRTLAEHNRAVARYQR